EPATRPFARQTWRQHLPRLLDALERGQPAVAWKQPEDGIERLAVDDAGIEHFPGRERLVERTRAAPIAEGARGDGVDASVRLEAMQDAQAVAAAVRRPDPLASSDPPPLEPRRQVAADLVGIEQPVAMRKHRIETERAQRGKRGRHTTSSMRRRAPPIRGGRSFGGAHHVEVDPLRCVRVTAASEVPSSGSIAAGWVFHATRSREPIDMPSIAITVTAASGGVCTRRRGSGAQRGRGATTVRNLALVRCCSVATTTPAGILMP